MQEVVGSSPISSTFWQQCWPASLQAALRLLHKGAGLADSSKQKGRVGNSLDHIIGSYTQAEAAEGQLVLFVGAGASVGSPSELPTFKKLTEQLYKKAKSAYLKIKQRLTRLLANQKVRVWISNSGSKTSSAIRSRVPTAYTK